MIPLSEVAKQRLLGVIHSPDIVEMDGKRYLVTDSMHIKLGPSEVGVVSFVRGGKIVHEGQVTMHPWKDLYANELNIHFDDLHALLEIKL